MAIENVPIQSSLQFREEVPLEQAEKDGIILLLLLDGWKGIIGTEAIAVGIQSVDCPQIVLAVGTPLQDIEGSQLKLDTIHLPYASMHHIRTDIRDPLLN